MLLLLAVPAPCNAPASQRIVEDQSISMEPPSRPSTAAVASKPAAAAPKSVVEPLPALPATEAPSAAAAPLPQPSAAAALPAQPLAATALPAQLVALDAPLPAFAKPPRQAQGGQVAVLATGGEADVYLGMRKLGTTPLRVWLPAGMRTLRFVPHGQNPSFLRRVAVSRGQSTRLNIVTSAAR